MNVTLKLEGHVPAKKNLWKRSKRGVYIDTKVASQIDKLTIQAAEQWRQREPAIHPDMTVQFYVKDRRPDLDNKSTTIWDCLRNAGVIRNDSVKWFNGKLTLLPAILDKDERVVIEVNYDSQRVASKTAASKTADPAQVPTRRSGEAGTGCH